VDIASVVIPVFSIAVLGYLVTWAGLFRTGDIAGLTRYVFSVALPVMLFDSMAKIALPETFQWSLMISYYVPTLLLFGVTALVGRSVFRQSRPERAIFAMGASYSNTVLIGLPIVSAAWGDEGLLPLLMIVTVHAAILFLVTTALAEAGGDSGRAGGSPRVRDLTGSGGAVASSASPGHHRDRAAAAVGILRRTAGGMIRNPILIGLATGLVANAVGFRLPGPLDTAAGMIRASAVPAALFVTGASLREFRITGHLSTAGTLVVLKMVVHPFLVWLPARFVFDLPPLWIAVAVLTAALPTGVNASVFARRYDASIAPVATATLVSTLLSVASISVLLALFAR
jgi:predicted permease